MDPDPAIFVSDLQDSNKKYFFRKLFITPYKVPGTGLQFIK
jgi:hypothetical protein